MATKIPLLITVDLEEFDIPLEFGQEITEQKQMTVAYEGLQNLLNVFDKYQVRATFFTTANWAKQYPETIKLLAQKHEIASHAFYHSQFSEEDYALSKNTLEAISGQPVRGFRMPRLRPVNFDILQSVGYTFDASLNPTYLPGRYNNFSASRTPFFNGKVHILPSSVTPILRIPLFWLSFKNLPNWVNKWLFNRICRNGLFVFYIHPWEFADIQSEGLPAYISKMCGDVYCQKLDNFFAHIAEKGTFVTCSDYLENNN